MSSRFLTIQKFLAQVTFESRFNHQLYLQDKSHNEKEALREKLRQYRDRALRSEEALEAVSAQIEAKV